MKKTQKKIKSLKRAAGTNKNPRETAKKRAAPKVLMLQIVPKNRKKHSNYIDGTFRTAFYKAYEETAGNISASCQLAQISRMTFYRWIKSKRPINVKFQERLKLIKPEERFLDFVDAALLAQIVKGDTTAIIFAAKTKGKKRGYIEPNKFTLDQTADELASLKKIIEESASRSGITYEEELKYFVENFASIYKPELVKQLESEMVN